MKILISPHFLRLWRGTAILLSLCLPLSSAHLSGAMTAAAAPLPLQCDRTEALFRLDALDAARPWYHPRNFLTWPSFRRLVGRSHKLPGAPRPEVEPEPALRAARTFLTSVVRRRMASAKSNSLRFPVDIEVDRAFTSAYFPVDAQGRRWVHLHLYGRQAFTRWMHGGPYDWNDPAITSVGLLIEIHQGQNGWELGEVLAETPASIYYGPAANRPAHGLPPPGVFFPLDGLQAEDLTWIKERAAKRLVYYSDIVQEAMSGEATTFVYQATEPAEARGLRYMTPATEKSRLPRESFEIEGITFSFVAPDAVRPAIPGDGILPSQLMLDGTNNQRRLVIQNEAA